MARQRVKPKGKVGLGPRVCIACGKAPAGGDNGPLPYGWQVESKPDKTFEKGYRLDVTCSGCRAF